MDFEIGEVLKDALMHTPHVAVLVVDQYGHIQFVNKTYQRVLRRTWEELVGRPIAEFTPESRTLIVLKTGEAIVGYNWSVNDHHGVAASLPLFKDGKIIGCFAYSLFLDVYDGRSMMEKLIHELNMYRDAV
ncbi:MAG: PAS domain-containing protein, partial [Syntrophomonadaceae bacterium]|nr:PAS domain-containing protein [Syntrophomonadaceae bacterium]